MLKILLEWGEADRAGKVECIPPGHLTEWFAARSFVEGALWRASFLRWRVGGWLGVWLPTWVGKGMEEVLWGKDLWGTQVPGRTVPGLASK